MSRFSFLPPRSNQHWFRIGSVDVTTTVLLAGISAMSMLVWAASPSFLGPFVLDTDLVVRGQIWRLVTWPFANTAEIWTAVSIYIFWNLGQSLEGMLGRTRFLRYIGVLTVVPAIGATLIALGSRQAILTSGMAVLVLAVVIAFAAVYPTARSFFGIPFWILAALIVGVDILQYVGLRAWSAVLLLLLVVATALITTRSLGISTVAWIPKIPLPAFITGDSSGKEAKKQQRKQHLRVVEAADIDSILDKIAAHGIESLTASERRRLDQHGGRRDN